MTERQAAGGGVVLVTGGINGIGRAITLALAARGHRVVAFGLEAPQTGSTARDGIAGTAAALAERGLSADLLEGDVTKADDVARIVRATLDRHGRIDGLVNNAAIRPTGSILETDEATWDRTQEVNLKGMYLTARAVVPAMIAGGGGAIVNMSSGSGWGRPGLLAYSTSKGGILAFSTSLAYDHFHDHVRVNVVIPGPTLTGQAEALGNVEALLPRMTNVAGRTTMPADIAGAVAFLLSDDAAAITGTVLDVGAFAGQGGPIPLKPATA